MITLLKIPIGLKGMEQMKGYENGHNLTSKKILINLKEIIREFAKKLTEKSLIDNGDKSKQAQDFLRTIEEFLISLDSKNDIKITETKNNNMLLEDVKISDSLKKLSYNIMIYVTLNIRNNNRLMSIFSVLDDMLKSKNVALGLENFNYFKDITDFVNSETIENKSKTNVFSILSIMYLGTLQNVNKSERVNNVMSSMITLLKTKKNLSFFLSKFGDIKLSEVCSKGEVEFNDKYFTMLKLFIQQSKAFNTQSTNHININLLIQYFNLKEDSLSFFEGNNEKKLDIAKASVKLNISKEFLENAKLLYHDNEELFREGVLPNMSKNWIMSQDTNVPFVILLASFLPQLTLAKLIVDKKNDLKTFDGALKFFIDDGKESQGYKKMFKEETESVRQILTDNNNVPLKIQSGDNMGKNIIFSENEIFKALIYHSLINLSEGKTKKYIPSLGSDDNFNVKKILDIMHNRVTIGGSEHPFSVKSTQLTQLYHMLQQKHEECESLGVKDGEKYEQSFSVKGVEKCEQPLGCEKLLGVKGGEQYEQYLKSTNQNPTSESQMTESQKIILSQNEKIQKLEAQLLSQQSIKQQKLEDSKIKLQTLTTLTESINVKP